MFVDFYIELPFRAKENGDTVVKASQNLLEHLLEQWNKSQTVEEFGYISILENLFNDCFKPNKENCVYQPNVRFHYVDIRQLQGKGEPILIGLSSYVYVDRLNNDIQIIKYLVGMGRLGIPFNEIPNFDMLKEHIEITNYLMEKLYLKGYRLIDSPINYNREIFMAHLDSDDFEADVTRILNDIEKYIGSKNTEDSMKISKVINTLKGFYTIRNGKKMHRIRAQFLALDQDGVRDDNGRLMSELIRDFILKEFNNVQQSFDLWTPWTKLYNVYKGLIKSTYGPTMGKKLDEAVIYLKELNDINKNNYILLIKSDVLLMDAYTLARIFRKYQGKTHKPSNEVVIFAGLTHINRYDKFFEDVLGLSSQFMQKNNDRCIVASHNQNLLDYY